MAYTKTPVTSSMDTKRLAFIASPDQRGLSPSQDFRLINMMTDVVPNALGDSKRYYVKNRPGLEPYYSLDAGEGRGLFSWLAQDKLVAVVGNKIYFNGTLSALTLSTTTGPVGMCEHTDMDGVSTMVLVDGVNGYVFTSPTAWNPIIPNTWQPSTVYGAASAVSPVSALGLAFDCSVAGTSGLTEPTWNTTVGGTTTDGTITWVTREQSFPSPHIPMPVFLDGYIFLAKEGTSDILNSELNEPLQWYNNNYITAEMYPGNIRALAKNNNYIYAVCENSIQYFFDAANATGSPLENNPGAVLQFGTPAPQSVVQTEKDVILVGTTGNGGYTVWRITGFKEKEISIPSVCAALESEGLNLRNAVASCIRVLGQKLYILRLTSRTLVYSFTTEMWSEWTASDNTNFRCGYSTDSGIGVAYLLDYANGRTYQMSGRVFQDVLTPYTCTIVSDKIDCDIINRKTMSRLSLITDIPVTTNSAYLDVSVRWSDDDYQTWSAARTMSMGNDYPAIRQLGDFRRRAFEISYASPLLLRLEGIEVDVNKGTR